MQAFCKTYPFTSEGTLFSGEPLALHRTALMPVQAFPISISVLIPLIDLELLENFVAPLLHEIIERDCSFFSCAP